MRVVSKLYLVTLTAGWLAASGPAPQSRAEIDLELRALPEPCVTRHLEFELYALSDDDSDQSIAALDVILAWDPLALGLEGISDSGVYPYNWLFSGFPDDHILDGLNDTWSDGNAFYEAYAQLGTPAYATPEGLLVVTFRFAKLRVGEATTVEMLDAFGTATETVVYDGMIPGLEVTGELNPDTVVPSPRGDMNCDHVVNSFDIDPFILALTDPVAYAETYPGCDILRADCNCNGYVNSFDIDPFVGLLIGD